MQMHAVSSTNLHSVGYDPVSHTLRVQFRSGSVYEYDGIGAAVFQSLMAAESKGKHFRQFISSSHEGRRIV